MTAVIKLNLTILLRINAVESDDRMVKVSGDIFDDGVGIRKIGPGIDIKAMLIFVIDEGFVFLKREVEMIFQKIKESGLEGFSEET